MLNYITINPFRKYAVSARNEAVALGIVRDVANATGSSKTKVSRTFAGEVKHPKIDVIDALNAWLKEHGFPLGDPNGRPTARNHINELRKASKAEGK